MAVVLVITGTTYWLAQRALPGDALYGLKRAGESVDLSTKGGDVSRGSAYLSISSTRIDEAFELVKRETSAAVPGVRHGNTGISAAGPLSPHVDELVHGVLTDGDTAAVTATRLLTTASVSDRAMNPASTVTTWLGDQHTKVGDLVKRLPETSPSTAGGAARHLQRDLARIQTRVKAIAASVKCGTCRFVKSDRLGPLPCRLCPTPAPTTTVADDAGHPPAERDVDLGSTVAHGGDPHDRTVAHRGAEPARPGSDVEPGNTGSTRRRPAPPPPATTTTVPTTTTTPPVPPPTTTTTPPPDTTTPAPADHGAAPDHGATDDR